MSDTADELGLYVVPDLTIKQLLDAIPYASDFLGLNLELISLFRAHCFKRSAVKSSLYVYVPAKSGWYSC